MFRLNGFIYVFLALSLAACGPNEFRYDIDASLDQRPVVEQLPIKIGVYYSPEFSTYEQRTRAPGHVEFYFIYQLGDASVALFDQALDGLFQEVVHIKTWPLPVADSVGFSAVIIPKVETVSVRSQPSMSVLGPFPVRISYRVSLHSPTGDEIANWVVSGSTAYEVSPGFDFGAQAKKKLAIRSALRDAGAKFVIGFRNQPDVKRWLHRQGIFYSAVEPKE